MVGVRREFRCGGCAVESFDNGSSRPTLLGAVALVLLGILSPNEARDAIDFDLIVVIGAAFGLAAAVESSGLGRGAAGSRGGYAGLLRAAGGVLRDPIAYRTNLMVHGSGGYRFGDDARLGTPLTLMALVALIPVTTVR